MELFDLAAANLISPPILFFLLGLIAALVRSDLAIPEAVAKGISIYLVMAIGFKGGAEMAASPLVAAALAKVHPEAPPAEMSAALPFISFNALRVTSRLPRVDAAAIAAHYGSISIVTFIAASDAGMFMGLAAAGVMVAVAAAMEAPAIFSGLALAGRREGEGGGTMIREIAFNGSIVLLIGAFAIGWATGERGMTMVQPFFGDIFRGVLCLFLLDMGLVAGRGLRRSAGKLEWRVLVHGLYMPLIGAAIALGLAALIGLEPGSAALLMTLAASASYIAVPAAMRLALPEADPSVSLTLSLGITFPFNLVFGIPLYFAAAQWALG